MPAVFQRILIGLLLALSVASSLLWAGFTERWDFSRIIPKAAHLYGQNHDAEARLARWQQLLLEQVGQDPLSQLDAVNRFFNLALRFSDDVQLWHVKDYWATPIEALYKGAGDCEDFAIAKYFTLRQLGVPSEKLRITYVKALRLNQAHMVLTYYPHPTATPLVLDNLMDVIEPATQRTDLAPVYAFNAEGVWMPGQSGDQQVSDAKRLSRWQDLLRKMHAEGFP